MQMRIKFCFLLCFIFVACKVQAQSSDLFMNDVTGKPLLLHTTYVAEGSPYFYEDYCYAQITAATGKIYSNVKVKIDLTDKSVIYQTESGAEMIATTPILQVKFMNFVSNGTAHGEVVLTGFNTSLNDEKGKVYQLIEDGKAKLLKELVVTYRDNKKYGEATITRVFTKIETFFGVAENAVQPKKIEKNKTSLASFFEAKQETIKTFIEEQKLKCKTENDFIRVFAYYNSL